LGKGFYPKDDKPLVYTKNGIAYTIGYTFGLFYPLDRIHLWSILFYPWDRIEYTFDMSPTETDPRRETPSKRGLPGSNRRDVIK
jgi:hypothetical protein